MTKPRRTPARQTVWLDWRPALAELFERFAGEDWTPPRQVKALVGKTRRTIVYEARFRKADGAPVKLVTRVRVLPDGSGEITEERLHVSYFLRSRPKVEARA
jgi:hypothetical protein